jgi:excinuclease ABC subunit C
VKRGGRAQRLAPLPSTDLDQLLGRVRTLAENRPAVYRMFDATGRVLYVGKAKRLRTRLLTYFRASYPDDKAARILYAAHDIQWDYVPSEFAAYLVELRQIRKFRPYFNHKGNRTRRSALIKIAGGPAPRVYGGGVVAREDIRC